MARSSHDGATPWLALVVGGLVVIVALLAFAMRDGGEVATTAPRNVDIDLSLPRPSLPQTPTLPESPIPTPK